MKIKFITILILGFVISCVTAQSPRKPNINSGATSPPQSAEQPVARVPGVLGFDSKELSSAISVPPTVNANKDFQVTITTSGNGCVDAGETAVILTENGADIFVYDFTTAVGPGIICTMILQQFPHTATLRFTKKGEAVIRVWGRRQGGTSPLGEPVVVEKHVTVK